MILDKVQQPERTDIYSNEELAEHE